MNNWLSHPDQVEAKVAEWQQTCPETLEVDSLQQFTGRPVFALTVTDRSVPVEGKKKLLTFTPHAHEPAANAALMNVVSQLLTGKTIGGADTALDRERILRELLLTVIPDANPGGTARAPVEAWDGSQYTNDEFWAWMRGVDPETGKMWKRLDLWDDREVQPLPTRYGIVYEKIDEHRYVEPNRHNLSSLMRLIRRYRQQYDYDAVLDLHQTEFVNSPHNCMVILPLMFDELPADIQTYSRAWAEALVEAWGRVPGAVPQPQIKPLGYTGAQREYLVNIWRDLVTATPKLTMEIQNNSPRTPPALQQRLEEVSVEVTLGRLLGG